MLRSLWLQWTGVFCSKPDDWCGNGTRVTQITSGANAPGAWGQTGANTANFVRSSLQSEGLLGAQCHLHMLGPFGKVPDRVTGAIFHALVQCVAPRGVSALPNSESHLSANCRGICFRSSPWDLLAISFQAFPPSPKFLGWLSLFGEPTLMKPHSGVWAVLDPTARPSRLQARERLSPPLAPTSGSFSSFLCFPLSLSIPSHNSFYYLTFHLFLLSSLSYWLSYNSPLLPPLYYSSLYSLLYSQSFSLFLCPLLYPSLSFSYSSGHLLSHTLLLHFSVL